MSLSIEPTTSCNLRCPECPSGLRSFTRPTGMLEPALFSGVLSQVDKNLISLTFYFQGEPFLNKRLPEMIKEASEKGIYTRTSTNAHHLTSELADSLIQCGLHELVISVDGASQEVYEQYRVGGSVAKVLESAKRIVNAKSVQKSFFPRVVFQYLVVRPNEHEVEKIKEIATELGVDEVRYKTAQVYNYKQGNPLIPNHDKYSRYRRKKDGTWELKNRLENHCWRMWQGCVVTWDGRVVPCCFDKDAAHQTGKLPEQGFDEVWRGDDYMRFRKAVFSNRKSIDICTNCSEGTKVFS